MKLHAKAIGLLLISVLMFGLLLTGCQETGTKVVPPTPPPVPPAVEKPADKYISKAANDPRGNEKWTMLAEYAGDLDADNQEEQIELLTSAGRDTKGNIMWDDGQKWLLLVRDGADYYPLFQEYVQLGSVYYSVVGYDNNSLPKVTVLVSTGAGLVLTNYAYEPEKKGFRIEPVYESKANNLQFTSLPGYE